MEGLEYFAGVDWGSETHQVCIVDSEGAMLGERAFRHGGAGLAEMADWLLATTGAEPHAIGVAIEIPHGPVVESLMERGCCSARGLRADRRDKLLKWLDTGGQNCTPNNT